MVQHPYVPRTLVLEGYEPNFLSIIEILAGYGIASVAVVVLIWYLSGKFRILTSDRLVICWMTFSGLTHIILEGYFVFTPDFYKKNTPVYLAEVWKEYSKGDSRYAARDSAVVAVEGITAVLVGPACLLAAYAAANKKPYSHPLQLSICLSQLYGCIVYFITPVLDNVEYAVGPFYFWFYYIFMNNIWVVIPSIIALRSWRQIVQAFQVKSKKK